MAHLGVALACLITFLAVGALVIAALDTPNRLFRSPDENAGYLFTKTLAQTGRLSYEADYLAGDKENLLHFRGAVTHGGKAVPFNYLGQPILYAPFYRLLRDDVKYVAVPISLVTVAALASAGALISPRRPWIAWLAVLAAAPLLHTFARPFLNLAPALMFGAIAAYFLIRYVQDPGKARGSLILSSLAFSLAAFMRYELVIFSSLLMVITVLHKQGSPNIHAFRDLAIFLGIVGCAFVLPVLILNYFIYGSPFTYGYGLFNEAYFPDRVAPVAGLWNYIVKARSVLLPAYPVDLKTAGTSLFYQVAGIAPFFTMAALSGAALLVRNRHVSVRMFVAALALALYTYLYRGAGDSNLAGETTANFEASIIRYSAPLLVVFLFLVIYAIEQINKAELTLLVLGILIFSSFSSLTSTTDGNLFHIRDMLRKSQPTLDSVLPLVEENAVVYTDIYDKVISDRRVVATWWGGASTVYGDEHFRPEEIADSVRRVAATRPVYFMVTDTETIFERLNAPMAERGLRLSPWKYKALLKVEPLKGTNLAPVDAR